MLLNLFPVCVKTSWSFAFFLSQFPAFEDSISTLFAPIIISFSTMVTEADSYTSFTTENNHIYVLHQVAPAIHRKDCLHPPAQVPKLSKNCAMTLISLDLVWRFLICKAIRLQQQHLNAGLCLCEAACFIMWVLLRLYPPAAHDAVIESKHLTCFRSTQRQQPFSSFLCKPFIA